MNARRLQQRHRLVQRERTVMIGNAEALWQPDARAIGCRHRVALHGLTTTIPACEPG
jgi:hypothetical protein